MKRAVFLDKDGTLIENVPYNVERERIALRPGAVDALLRLAGLGYELIVVSNQPGVALGRFPAAALHAVERHLNGLFLAGGLKLTECCWCPHHPEGRVEEYARDCSCRKPLPGMLHAAAARHAIDLARSWLIGDILDDVEAGHRAGCRAVLLDVGSETEWLMTPLREPDVIAHDLLEAAAAIVSAGSAARHAPRRGFTPGARA
jgi:histidinol-phosphate phosphatase family protein